MSEIQNFKLSALISQMPPHLIFILVSAKSTCTCYINMVISSLPAQLLQNCALIRTPENENYR